MITVSGFRGNLNSKPVGYKPEQAKTGFHGLNERIGTQSPAIQPYQMLIINKSLSFGSIDYSQRLPLKMSEVNTTEEFVNQMRDVVKDSPWVSIDQEKLAQVSKSYKQRPQLFDWKGYISDETHSANPPDLNKAMFEFAIIIANQSGFIIGEEGEKGEKWGIKGSGAKAMVQKTAAMREQGGITINQSENPKVKIIIENVKPLLEDVPFKENRLAIFEEFAKPDAYEKIGKILEQSKTGENEYTFSFDSVQKLAKAFPKSFGEDPFYKKASLLFIAMTGFGRSKGIDVKVDVPVASDYRLPKSLEDFGILKVNPELREAVNKDKVLHEDHPAVQHLRAATVVACADLSKQTGFDSAEVDFPLWSKKSEHHLMVPTMRF